ncbi:sensor histidine kinase [Dyella silvatica]|uniref:sensor histidine kinase n=1 Tax=Dyella silvatica TaxID=2992128 RepID=UPI00225BC4B8|nr:histidine kinase [Dyella silvatica]
MPTHAASTVNISSTDARARLKTYALGFGFWTLLALSSSISMMLTSINEGVSRSWQRTLAWNLPDFYLWMLLAPLIGWLGRRSAHYGWGRFLAVHLPASVVMSALQTTIMLHAYWQWHGSDPISFKSLDDLLRIEFIYQFHLGVITYWLILTILRGLDSRRRLKGEQLRNAQLQGQLAQAQLQALRMQLQPHFLFNTLNAISALALAAPSQARVMIARLSDFLRLTLEEDHTQSVPLARELQYLDCYLAIQQIRFQDRLSTQLEIAADTLNAAVPHLILQPLVENALHHGLLPMPGYGVLRIAIRRDHNDLLVLVEDDGQGLPAGDLVEGIGLGNTRARLSALGAGQLALQPRPEGGTRVELRMPFALYAA